jgi:hypothetical protein
VLLLVTLLVAAVASALVVGFQFSGPAPQSSNQTRLTAASTASQQTVADLAASRAAADDPGDLAAVGRLLGGHGAALRARDKTGWAAGLDPSTPAAGYRGAQLALFDNIGAVPLSAWSYQLREAVLDPTVLAAAQRRLGGVVLIVHVQLSYAITTVDPAATGKDLWLTAALRDGSWKLSGDRDATALGDNSWRGLWDFGPVTVFASEHGLVLGHPAHTSEAPAYAAILERAVPVVNRAWGSDWNDHVAVLIPDSAAEFAAVTGDSGDVSQLAALSVADGVLPQQAPGAATVLGARIVLNPDNVTRLSPAARQLVVQHELTHTAARSVTDDAMPIWVIEGFADYVGNLDSGRSAPESAPELARDLKLGLLPSRLPTAADFAGDNRKLSETYEQAWLACSLIANRIGTVGLVRFYKAVSAAARVDPATAAAVGLRVVLNSTVASFTASWQRYLQADLG